MLQMMIIIYLCPYSVDEYNQYDDNGQYNNQYNGDHDHANDDDDDNNNHYPDPYQQQYLPTNNEAVDNDDDNDDQHQYAPYEQIEHGYDDDDVNTGIDQHYPSSYQPNYQPNNYQSSYQTDYKTDYTPQSYTVPYDGMNQYPQFTDDGVDDDNNDDHHSYGNDQLQYEADQKQQQQSFFPQFNDDSGVDSPGTHFIT